MKILVTANSPGEVAWVKPLAYEAQRRGLSLDVILYPCTFATGHEAEVLRSYPAVERVWQSGQLVQLALKRQPRYPAGTPLIHLGGDLMYTAYFSWRWGWRCYSYLWARPWWNGFFSGFFSRNLQSTRGLLKRRVAPHRIFEVGDLVVDAVDQSLPQLPARDPHLITFLPGSRGEEVRHLLPFMARVGEILQAQFPKLRFQVNLSPFLELSAVRSLLERAPDPRLEGASGQLIGAEYHCDSGLILPLIQREGLGELARSSLAVSIPGTKTAEAACLGTPCLTLVPLNCPEWLPYGGLLGLLDWVPGGKAWKGAWLLRQRGKIGLLAQPNQLLGQAILPELVDHLTAQAVAEQVARVWQDPELKAKGLLLRQAYRELRGCSASMLDALMSPSFPRSGRTE